MKESFSDYTEAEFIQLMQKIRAANKNAPDKILDPLLQQFCEITEHPDGTDLIYYPEDGAGNSNEGIAQTVKKWRAAQGLPGFKGERPKKAITERIYDVDDLRVCHLRA
ncbi:colicin immunity protein ImmE2 [Pseudomonas fluorescens HK44]|uniref:Colicin immunity protein ImmE2 n=1 Tax=Pseudomonas fluorescens HK44 TaxID=1042209 RepID=A0A010SW18_PSEFL|nr:colicin immunity protein ImmE2 [Pseudomonas fluorescens HK44]